MVKNWIAEATKNKGSLHRSLGVGLGKTIAKGMIAKAAKRGGVVGQRARLAQTLAKFRKKKKKKK
jgi:hypothetical protein